MVQGGCRKQRGMRDWGNPRKLGISSGVANCIPCGSEGSTQSCFEEPAGRQRAVKVVTSVVVTEGVGDANPTALPSSSVRVTFRGRKHDVLSESRAICMSGSMRVKWKRGYGKVTWAPPDERGGQQTIQTYCYRATSLLYRLCQFDLALGSRRSSIPEISAWPLRSTAQRSRRPAVNRA